MGRDRLGAPRRAGLGARGLPLGSAPSRLPELDAGISCRHGPRAPLWGRLAVEVAAAANPFLLWPLSRPEPVASLPRGPLRLCPVPVTSEGWACVGHGMRLGPRRS